MATSTTETRAPLQAALDEATGLKSDTVDRILNEIGITPEAGEAEPSDEQKARFANPPEGLRGKALARYLVTGEGAGEQTREAKAKREAESGNGKHAATGPREGSMTAAMIEVLRGKRKGISAKEIWAEIQRRGLWSSPKGKTPDATIGAKLATEAKKPHGLFKRTEPGRFVLRSDPSPADQAAKAGRARQGKK